MVDTVAALTSSWRPISGLSSFFAGDVSWAVTSCLSVERCLVAGFDFFFTGCRTYAISDSATSFLDGVEARPLEHHQ
jgi:hypothetical protein